MLYNKYDMFFPGKFYFAKVVKIRQKTTTFASKQGNRIKILGDKPQFL